MLQGEVLFAGLGDSMNTLIRPPRRANAFTLIELMIVVSIVAILATVQLPMYRAHITSAKMSEGIAGVGTIRTAMRVYSAGHNGNYPTYTAVNATGLSAIGIHPTDLDGKFFQASNYLITSATTTYTIQATLLPGGDTYIIDQNGVEHGSYKTGQ